MAIAVIIILVPFHSCRVTASSLRVQWVNSLAPGKCECNLKLVISKLISKADILSISYEIALRLMLQNTFDMFNVDIHSQLQVMAWCHQATSQYLRPNIEPDLWRHMVSPGSNVLILRHYFGIIPSQSTNCYLLTGAIPSNKIQFMS